MLARIRSAAVLGIGYHVQPSTAQVLAPVLSVAALIWVARSWRIKRGNPRPL